MKTLTDETIREINIAVSRWFKSQGISHAEAAQRLGVAPASVSMQISWRHFSPKSARRWSEVFGFSEKFLLTGEGPIMNRQSGYRKIIAENDELRNTVKRQESELLHYRSLYGPLPDRIASPVLRR